MSLCSSIRSIFFELSLSIEQSTLLIEHFRNRKSTSLIYASSPLPSLSKTRLLNFGLLARSVCKMKFSENVDALKFTIIFCQMNPQTFGECKFNRKEVGATIAHYTDLPVGDEEALRSAVTTVGPISVAIDASQQSFHFYHSGELRTTRYFFKSQS